MSENTLLFRIQRLQFSARDEAEALLLAFVQDTFPQLDVVRLNLRPQATSLNSFNGFLHLVDGLQLFFKTHVEQDNVIGEYYNAEMLAEAGYPVIQPLYSSTSAGQQLLIYPMIDAPPVFDVARQIENTGNFGDAAFAALSDAQNASDDALYQCYLRSLDTISTQKNLLQPIHQLFWHRLTGGRLERFYGDETRFVLPHGEFSNADVFDAHWKINGIVFPQSLKEVVEQAKSMLAPMREEISIIGHGDAHNGNVFQMPDGLVYFDPAFAGRHAPLLDLVKPLFHNAFAMWMYFPEQERDKLSIKVEIDANGIWCIEHDYQLNPLREMFFTSKFERVLRPIHAILKAQNALSEDWRERLKLALMCCPLLTMNLTGFNPEIALLGLCHAVEMGMESQSQRSYLDAMLDTL